MHTSAQWIWSSTAPKVNATLGFRKTFEWSQQDSTPQIAITADSRYRLYLNGEWVGDGPGRAWLEHYSYDTYPLGGLLRAGRNQIEVVVSYWGRDNFQHTHGEPGLLCALSQGDALLCCSDASWQVAPLPEYLSAVPRFGCQMDFEEVYDARLAGEPAYAPVDQVRAQSNDAHQNLQARRTPPLSRIPRTFDTLLRKQALSGPAYGATLPRDDLFKANPTNTNIAPAHGLVAKAFETESAVELEWVTSFGFGQFFIDGQPIEATSQSWCGGMRRFRTQLSAGRHLLTLHFAQADNINEVSIAARRLSAGSDPIHWDSSRDGSPSPWFASAACAPQDDPQALEWAKSRDLTALQATTALRPFEALEFSPSFRVRSCIPGPDCATGAQSERPLSADWAGDGECQFLFDLGELSVGYPALEIEAAPGTYIDGYLVEHIENLGQADEWIHHMANKQNGFRVICADGTTRWTMKQRRGGRFLFLQVYGPRPAACTIQSLQLIEATYPVTVENKGQARFECSDPQLNRMHRMALRTLQLCMEDTFTDCPTYEQVTWIGDARNEAIFNYFSYGRGDIVRRGIEIGAESLAHQNLVCSMGPNECDFEIPTWSFLWGIQVWEYYWYSADREFLTHIYPAVQLNLSRALERLGSNGLFTGPGMFDWTPIDHDKPYVTHAQLFLIHALDCAARCAEVLQQADDAAHYRQQAEELRERVVALLWCESRAAFADSMDADGQLSPKSCLHTIALGLLYGVIPAGWDARFKAMLLNPPAELTEFGSPFAKFYWIEALLQSGEAVKALEILHAYWQHMMVPGATTFWEMINADWLAGESPQATRSHCHGWSAAPLSVFAETLLGVEVLEPGFRKIRVRPTHWHLEHASGSMTTPLGELRIHWDQTTDPATLQIEAPEGMEVLH